MICEIDDHLAHLPPSDLRRLPTIVLLLAHDEAERAEGLLRRGTRSKRSH
jgi:hypothetical protein